MSVVPFIQRVFLQQRDIALLPTGLARIDAIRHIGTICGTVVHSLRAGEWPQANCTRHKPCQSPPPPT